MLSLLQRLKERKMFQWALAYLAGAWLVFQGIEVLAEPWNLSEAVQRTIHLLLGVGLFVTLILAWFHGEKGRQRVGGVELLILAGILVIAGVAVTTLGAPRDDRSLPLVIMMDSPHPSRVYDEEILSADGTNADVISDILLDLPIRRQKEAIGPDWHRDEEILSFDPDLIIIHYSGFRQDFEDQPRERLRLFISYMAESDAQFLIYSRRSEAVLRDKVTELLRDLDREHPGLLDRVRTLGLEDFGRTVWRDPASSTHLKLAVKEMLDLE